jgi:serine/threonine protein kinase
MDINVPFRTENRNEEKRQNNVGIAVLNQSPPNKNIQNHLDKSFEISYSDLKIVDKLGGGAFGIVYKAIYKDKEVAVKRVIESAQNVPQIIEAFRRELDILVTLDHPSIVKCLGGCSVPPNLFIVTEYCNGGSLFALLHVQRVKLSTEQQIQFALQIAQGMEYLHTRNPMVVHRDLKSPNVLLHNGVPKIIDFGVSHTKKTLMSLQTSHQGTWNWMAPELMTKGATHTEKVDVWSFGMVMFELATNKLPYWNCNNEVQIIREVCDRRNPPQIPKEVTVHSKFLKLMKQCWRWDPQQRPSFSQITQTLQKLLKQQK